MTIILKNRAGETIQDLEGWKHPKRDYHWQDGYSAKELARAWFNSQTPQCPPELQALFSSHPRTAHLQINEGFPEFITGLPERGGSRNHDLMLRAHTDAEAVIVCVEAKVDESFSATIGSYWKQKSAGQQTTRVPARIETLLKIVFGKDARPDQQPWCDLRYQLLTGVAGTLIQAAKEQAPLAVFIVHEFQTFSVKPNLLKTNGNDYDKFVAALFAGSALSNQKMYGPLSFQQGIHLPHPVELFIGKAMR